LISGSYLGKTMNYPKAKKKSLMAGLAVVFAVLEVSTSTASAKAATYDFNFQFNAQETGAPVSGDFLFDDTIAPIAAPDAGNVYLNASSKYTINVGKEVFQGATNSVGVGRNLINPATGQGEDTIFFDNLQNFNPTSPKFLASFVYPPNSLSSNALSDLSKNLPKTAFALINTPTGLSLSSANTVTKITAVPESTSTLGVFSLVAVVASSVLKRKQSSVEILATTK
jgi:hypothetical protein